MTMTPDKRLLLSKLYSELGYENGSLNLLIELVLQEDTKFETYKEAVCENVNTYHNDKKELVGVVEELIVVISAINDYDRDKSAQTSKRTELLWDTAASTLSKALKLLNKNK